MRYIQRLFFIAFSTAILQRIFYVPLIKTKELKYSFISSAQNTKNEFSRYNIFNRIIYKCTYLFEILVFTIIFLRNQRTLFIELNSLILKTAKSVSMCPKTVTLTAKSKHRFSGLWFWLYKTGSKLLISVSLRTVKQKKT